MARTHLELDADYSASSPAAHQKMDGPSIQEPKPPNGTTISAAPL
jgi:hypothetical protein